MEPTRDDLLRIGRAVRAARLDHERRRARDHRPAWLVDAAGRLGAALITLGCKLLDWCDG